MNNNFPIDEVLIVDDDEIALLAQEQLLETFAIARQVISLDDGAQAINFIKNNWMGKMPPQPKRLLLLDLRMPNMSGMEFLERFSMLQQTEGIAIVVLSSIVPEFIKNHAKTFNIVGCYEKPLTRQKMDEIIQKM